jgi:hypothetical protein
MEVVCIINIFNLCWIDFVSQSSKVIFVKLSLVLGRESVLWGMSHTFFVLIIDSSACSFSETFSIQVFACNLRYISSVTGNMLSFDILSWATNPILTFHGCISVLNSFSFIILDWWCYQIIILLVVWF